jgi:hypothetical protein
MFALEVGLKASLKAWSSTHRSLSGAISFKWFSHSCHHMSNSVSLVFRRHPRLDAVLPAVPGSHAGLPCDPGLLAQLLPLLPGEARRGSAHFYLPSSQLPAGTSYLSSLRAGSSCCQQVPYQRSTYSYKLLTGSSCR